MRCNYCGVDNPDGAVVCIGCRAQLSPGAMITPKASGMAIAALILGILGFPTCGLTSFLAIILGIVALVQQSKPDSNVGGKNLAIAGLVTGGLSLVVMPLMVLPAILFPVFSRAQMAAQRSHCMDNMKHIGGALRMYCADNGGVYPSSALHTGSNKWNADGFVNFAMYTTAPDGKPTMYQALSQYVRGTDIMWCPSDPELKSGKRSRVSYYYKAAADRSSFDGKQIGRDSCAIAEQIVFWEHNDWHHGQESIGVANGARINMLFADGHIANKCVSDSGYSVTENPPTPLPKSGRGEPAWFNTGLPGTNAPFNAQLYDVTYCADSFPPLEPGPSGPGGP